MKFILNNNVISCSVKLRFLFYSNAISTNYLKSTFEMNIALKIHLYRKIKKFVTRS